MPIWSSFLRSKLSQAYYWPRFLLTIHIKWFKVKIDLWSICIVFHLVCYRWCICVSIKFSFDSAKMTNAYKFKFGNTCWSNWPGYVLNPPWIIFHLTVVASIIFYTVCIAFVLFILLFSSSTSFIAFSYPINIFIVYYNHFHYFFSFRRWAQ